MLSPTPTSASTDDPKNVRNAINTNAIIILILFLFFVIQVQIVEVKFENLKLLDQQSFLETESVRKSISFYEKNAWEFYLPSTITSDDYCPTEKSSSANFIENVFKMAATPIVPCSYVSKILFP